MRKITLITLMLFTALSYAQVGINTNTPNASSALEIESTTGGILIPRMTETQRDAIVSPASGLMIYQTDEVSGFYFYNGIQWTSVGMSGPQGPQGETGATGETGPQGIPGNTGPAGVQGPQGDQGPAGPQGLAGADGEDGAQGPEGPQGDQGIQGATGAQGPAGPIGNTGPAGVQGPQGDQGVQGIQGEPGPTGQPGAQGLAGSDGEDGANGTNGTNGGDGSSAYQIWINAGNTGTESEFLSSLLGADGEDGAQGPIGPAGADADISEITALSDIINNGQVAQSLSIGDFVGGGYVFWIDPTDNTKGLVSAVEDQSTGIRWFNGTHIATGATGTAIGTGAVNTTAIINAQGETETSYAAGLASAYNGGGYTDWFFPSKDELNEMYINKSTLDAISGFTPFSPSVYWTSSEVANNRAWKQNFNNGGQVNDNAKHSLSAVRAIRAVSGTTSSSLSAITAEQTAQNTAIDLKANIASPTFTGTVSGITKSMVGLANVDNTTDANKPISTAMQTALDLKAPLDSPTFTGTITAGAITIPSTDGTSGQVLATDGSGTLSWTTPSTGLDSVNGTVNEIEVSTSNTTTTIGLPDNTIISTSLTVNGLYFGNSSGGGNDNLAIGSQLGSGTGHRNTALGKQALDSYSGTSFDNNTAVGYYNLRALTTGYGNTGLGAENMFSLTTGSSNTGVGNQTMLNVTTGNQNTGLGQRAGQSITTGSNNTLLGFNANVSSGSANNEIVIGQNTTGAGDNTITLGNINVTDVYMAQDSGATIHAADLNLDGTAVTATATEMNYLDGVTSNIQTQIDALNSGGVTTYSVGDMAQGGKVFWVDSSGQHGLVVALEDAGGSLAMDWNAGTASSGLNLETLAQSSGIYAGRMNTAIIIAVHAAAANNGNNFAARACNEYTYTQNGVEYADWYLPSKDELHLIKTSGVGAPNLYSYNYWSSTEYDANNAYAEVLGNYANNYNQYKPKDTTEGIKVRAVRSF